MISIDDFEKRFAKAKDIQDDKQKIEELFNLTAELESDISYVREEYFRENSFLIACTGQMPKEQKRVDELMNLLLRLCDIKTRVEKYVRSLSIFDKNLCLENIRTLLRTSDVKLGNIERAAKVRVGYLSILESDKGTSEPSLRFVATAAKMLKVSLDDLLYIKFEDLTEDEQLIKDFLADVLDDTLKKTIVWRPLNEVYFIKTEGRQKSFPCKDLHPKYYQPLDAIKYKSKFYDEGYQIVNEGSYRAKLPNMCGELYVINCSRIDSEGNTTNEPFYEIYLIESDQAKPLCNTIDTKRQIISVIDELCKAAVASADTRQLIDADTRSILNKYRVLKKEVDHEAKGSE